MRLIWMWPANFFAQCTNDKFIDNFISSFEENLFLCMELTKQSYESIMMMPVDRFYKLLKWKIKFDEEVNKMKEDEYSKNTPKFKTK